MSARLNLLSTSVQRRQAVGKLLRYWAWVGAAAAVIAIFTTIFQWHLGDRIAARHAGLQTSFDATQRTLESVKEYRRELESIRGRESVALSLASEKSAFTLLGLFAAAAQASDGGVAIQNLTLLTAPLSTGDRAANSSRPSSHIELRGVATGNVALAEFVAALRAREIFASVDLKSTGAIKIGEHPARSYVIQCEY